MKRRYEYIHFVKIADKPKTSVWECCNNRSSGTLGWVKWYGPWRQYCFFPTDAVFNDACLRDVCHFIGQLKAGGMKRGTT